MAKITEGYMPFHGYQTYYRIVGEQKDNGKAPLICLHGGPGSTHNYYEVLDKRTPWIKRMPHYRTVMGRNDADRICHRAWSRRGKILHHFFRTSKQQPVGKRRYA